ncbi:MAG: C25 family cysteine peptidase [Phycisphaerae bacterium]
MRWCCRIGLGLLLLAGVATTVAAQEPLSVDYAFDRPNVVPVAVGDQTYDRVVMPGCANGGNAGQPLLPASGARILLPCGTEVADVQVIADEWILVGQGYQIEPGAQPVPLRPDVSQAPPPVPDPVIYASNEPFPPASGERIGTYGFRGYQILVVKLQPVQYLPANGELYYAPHLTVQVTLAETGRASSLYRGLPEDEAAVLAKVDNPEQTRTYAATGIRGSRSYSLLILTTPTLATTFEPLATYHNVHGVPTEIHTTTEAGGTDPDTIRSYITTRYMNDGIEYVIIGADDDDIPAKDLYVTGGGETETAMPGDIYFACLDGTWNYDGDARWGEPTDGPGGGDVDLLAEVCVGRASVDNATEAARFVTKTLWYLNGQHPHPERVLMVGEYLGFGGIANYGGNMMDQLIDGSSADGYTTVGIPTSDYEIDKLYERDQNWGTSDIVNKINNGVHFLNHMGHGSPNHAMNLYDYQLLELTNTTLCFVDSQTCLAGHFDGTDCWAEIIHIGTDYGAFAVIMNARYGWGTSYSLDGPSQRFHREFWDAVFSVDELKCQLGPASRDSKEDNLYRINESCMRWCYYEITLFGDPTIHIGLEEPALCLRLPEGVPDILEPGQATPVTVEIMNAVEVYEPGTGLLHYRYDGGAWQTAPMTFVSGNFYEAILPAAMCDAEPEYYFSATGDGGTTIVEPKDAPAVVYSAPVGAFVTLHEDNCEASTGWTVGDTGDDATVGIWSWGNPVGTGAQPEDDHTLAPGVNCWATDIRGGDLGTYDVDGGKTTLKSPVLDLSGQDYAAISYWRWYSNDAGATPNTDVFTVDVTNNGGGSWVNVEVVGPSGTGTGGGWYQHTFNVADIVTPTAQVQLRFIAADEGQGSLVEAAIDDLLIIGVECELQYVAGDMNCDSLVDNFDISPFVMALTNPTGYAEAYPDCNILNGDINGDGELNNFDIGPFVTVLTNP